MFRVNSLKKGGIFYLSWLADSWPAQFASITQSELWSQDIRKICDELLQVVIKESERPSHRFSLRLSSQLMRGLVRLYRRKVDSMLDELRMLDSSIIKHARLNKVTSNAQDEAEEMQRHTVPMLKEEEQEEGVDEMLQDDFDVEDLNQALQFLDQTFEQMLGASGLDSTLDASEPTASTSNQSRLQLDNTLEPISDQETILFRNSTAQDLLPEELVREAGKEQFVDEFEFFVGLRFASSDEENESTN